MPRLLLLFTALALTNPLFGQKKGAPPWLDYSYRATQYPEDRYLVGYATELNVAKKQAAATFDRLNQLARNQIIEAIHVSIQAQSELDIKVENSQTDERFRQLSRSASKAQLVGLKYENYYDKKKETAYAFSYVLIKDIIDYYFDIVKNNLTVIAKDLAGARNTPDKLAALELIYEARLKLAEIDRATIILTALKQAELVDFITITNNRQEIEEVSNEVLGTPTVKVNHLAAYFAYALLPQLDLDNKTSLCAGALSYMDSGVESEFSSTLLSSTLNLMVNRYDKLYQAGEQTPCDLQLQGHYQVNPQEILVNLQVVDKQSGNRWAGIEKSLPRKPIDTGGRKLLPANFEWITKIPAIKLIGLSDELTIKTNEYIDKPISFVLLMDDIPQADLPVKLSFLQDGRETFHTTVRTNKSGMGRFFLTKEAIPQSAEYELRMMLDVATLLGIDPASNFYQTVMRDYPPQFRQIKLKILSPTVYVQSKEFNLGQPLEVPLLEPAIKNALIENDFKFVDDPTRADYTLTIDAKTRQGQQSGNIHFSYLDATVALVRNSTGKEIYKNVMSSVKGASADFKLAGVKAYEKAIKSMLPDFLAKLNEKK